MHTTSETLAATPIHQPCLMGSLLDSHSRAYGGLAYTRRRAFSTGCWRLTRRPESLGRDVRHRFARARAGLGLAPGDAREQLEHPRIVFEVAAAQEQLVRSPAEL